MTPIAHTHTQNGQIGSDGENVNRRNGREKKNCELPHRHRVMRHIQYNAHITFYEIMTNRG